MRFEAAARPASTSPRCSRRRMAGADGRRHESLGRIQPDPRRLGLVARRQQCGAFRRGLERFRDDDGDRLVGVTDPVVLQEIEPEHEGIGFFVRILRQRRFVGRRHHLDDARMGFRGGNIEERDAAARDAAHRQDRVEHSRADDCRRRSGRRP